MHKNNKNLFYFLTTMTLISVPNIASNIPLHPLFCCNGLAHFGKLDIDKTIAKLLSLEDFEPLKVSKRCTLKCVRH